MELRTATVRVGPPGAEFILVFARVDLAKGYKGITCFIVPKELDVEVAKKEEKLGIRASSTCTLNFDDVKVPAENVLGRVGKGYKIAIEILNEGRIGIAAQMLGLAQGAFDTVVPYTFERKQFSQPIGTFQGMQHQMTKAAIDIETARLLTGNLGRDKEEELALRNKRRIQVQRRPVKRRRPRLYEGSRNGEVPREPGGDERD
ncbi:acyl-CoA dehydrogenase NM domain-like protein [Coprinellus micaceus]|uniref:Acyl-CoA dehydrogenase NM domain-like protein n=1 Tax=Coprinellus micaceus TaxID=71717 RepID=A0A4Y7SDU6_COPMI|nr:acyl-CoA dehydrogenase NM domain-like protein [Coprinellus micaceus]